MRKIFAMMILAFILAGCRKEDLVDVTAAASAAKGIPVLSEIWRNGVLEQKNYYENGRLVRISWPSGQLPREHQYSFRDKDHYVVMTGDYMYYHYYFNEAHQLVRMELSDENNSPEMQWVRHEFTWEKDRIKTHTWMMGNLLTGNFMATVERYEYKGPWEAVIREYALYYTNGVPSGEELSSTHYYHWKSPFEYRFMNGPQDYTAYLYSTTIRMPGYNTVGFPWGYYSMESLNKHELMNLLANTWTVYASQGDWKGTPMSGMLLLEVKTVNNGQETLNSQLRNIVTNKYKLPVSYDVFDHQYNTQVHYEYKYVVL
jgi:hypothetical protein